MTVASALVASQLVTGHRRTSWTAADLLSAEFPEPRWAVPGLIAEGLTIFAGAPKMGKSWLLLNLAPAIAAGGYALGRAPVDRGEVLYLALEDPPRRLQQRLRVILDGDDVPHGLYFETEWPRLLDGGAERLGGWLTEHPDCRLVAVDVFARVRPMATERVNPYEADYHAAALLKTLADEHRVAIVAAHHTRKAGADDFLETISGTHGLAGAADAVVVMRRARNSADATLLITGRDVEEAEYALRFDRGTWTLLEGPASDYELSDTRRQILEFLRDFEGVGPKEIAERLELDHELVKKSVQRMFKDGQVDSDGQGRYCVPPVGVSLMSPGSLNGDSGDTRDRVPGSETA